MPPERNKILFLTVGNHLEGSTLYTTYITGGANRPETERRVKLFDLLCQVQPRKRNRKPDNHSNSTNNSSGITISRDVLNYATAGMAMAGGKGGGDGRGGGGSLLESLLQAADNAANAEMNGVGVSDDLHSSSSFSPSFSSNGVAVGNTGLTTRIKSLSPSLSASSLLPNEADVDGSAAMDTSSDNNITGNTTSNTSNPVPAKKTKKDYNNIAKEKRQYSKMVLNKLKLAGNPIVMRLNAMTEGNSSLSSGSSSYLPSSTSASVASSGSAVLPTLFELSTLSRSSSGGGNAGNAGTSANGMSRQSSFGDLLPSMDFSAGGGTGDGGGGGNGPCGLDILLAAVESHLHHDSTVTPKAEPLTTISSEWEHLQQQRFSPPPPALVPSSLSHSFSAGSLTAFNNLDINRLSAGSPIPSFSTGTSPTHGNGTRSYGRKSSRESSGRKKIPSSSSLTSLATMNHNLTTCGMNSNTLSYQEQ
jgi:hypothetical protein